MADVGRSSRGGGGGDGDGGGDDDDGDGDDDEYSTIKEPDDPSTRRTAHDQHAAAAYDDDQEDDDSQRRRDGSSSLQQHPHRQQQQQQQEQTTVTITEREELERENIATKQKEQQQQPNSEKEKETDNFLKTMTTTAIVADDETTTTAAPFISKSSSASHSSSNINNLEIHQAIATSQQTSSSNHILAKPRDLAETATTLPPPTSSTGVVQQQRRRGRLDDWKEKFLFKKQPLQQVVHGIIFRWGMISSRIREASPITPILQRRRFESFLRQQMRQQNNWSSLARLVVLLREYEAKFDKVPNNGNLEQTGVPALEALQHQVLSQITKELYANGTPTWVLKPVLERIAQGLTGRSFGIYFMILPYQCFISYPSPLSPPVGRCIGTTTDMIQMEFGFHYSRLAAVEPVAARLASFASSSTSADSSERSILDVDRTLLLGLQQQQQQYQVVQGQIMTMNNVDPNVLVQEILNLASSTDGLAYHLFNRPKEFHSAIRNVIISTKNSGSNDGDDALLLFWQVQDSTRDLFYRLVTQESHVAMESILSTRQDSKEKQLYSYTVMSLFRVLTSAGACALWFGGSFHDMMASGVLTMVAAYIRTLQILSWEERILSDVVASMLVGFVAGLLAIHAPDKFCFGAIAVASVMEALQGFKVTFAVMEGLSKQTVAGAARLLEGLLVTGLITCSLRFGLDAAFRVVHGTHFVPGLPGDISNLLVSSNGVSEKWFPLLWPLASLGWSGLFQPGYADLPWMTFHGILAFALNWAGANMFVAAMGVTLSAGIVSRITGREALGNTMAGLYVLVPGAYMVRVLLSSNRVGFIENVLLLAGAIGFGAWTGKSQSILSGL
jgi:uncharacterized membrane protein YjjB (DUF3815 family)